MRRAPLVPALALALLVAPAAGAAGPDATKLVPIVLDVAGVGNARYTTELALANRGSTPATAQLTYTPASALGASGGGSTNLVLPAGGQVVVPDVLAMLRSKGLPIPSGSNQGGTLLVAFTGLSAPDVAYAGARTTTPSGAGRAGLAYPGVDLANTLTQASYVYGLRSNASDRTNLALVNASAAASVTLRVTLYAADAGDARTYVLSPDTTLAPLQWTQIGRVLDLAGFANAFAKVEIVSGAGPYVAYAVVNDNTTNDGSYLAAEPASIPSEARLVPVLVESAAFATELTLANPLNVSQTANLAYVESASSAGGAGGSVSLSLAAGEQKVIPNAIDFLRQHGAAIGPKGPTYAGALSVSFLDAGARSYGFAGARTAAPVAGTGPGEYGLFYAGVGGSDAAVFETWVYGLQQNAASRANLAVANLGDAGDAITVRVDVYDGDTGKLAGSTTPGPLPAGGWTQLNAVLQGFGVANGYAHVVKIAGAGRFAAYGVVNDGGAPGQGTSDGSYVTGQPVPPVTSFSVGADIALSYPNLPILSDEHTTVFPPASASGKYLVFAANMRNAAGLAGPVVLESADLRTFTLAQGFSSPVMTAPVAFGSCKAAWDPTFDLNYASPGSVVQDPTRPPGNLVMIYEAENHCPGAVWQHDFYATVGFARSPDGGKTWPAPVLAELGGTDRYPVLKSATPEPATPENPTVAMGNAIPSAFVDGTNLYVQYNTPGPSADGMMRVARAALGGGGTIAFSKWYEGSFGQPGIGGLDSPMLPAKGCVGHQGMGQIGFDDALGLYLLTFVCSGTTTGAWYYSLATSLETQNWSAPRMIDGSQYPIVSGCASDGTGTAFDGWYPSFVSPGVAAGHTSLSGSVLFMSGCDRGSRTFLARRFTITAPPRP